MRGFFLLTILCVACGSVESGDDDESDLADARREPDGSRPIDAAVFDVSPIDVAPPDAFVCEAGSFQTCDNGAAVFCNGTGDGVTTQACGAPGCNQQAGRCNECVPSEAACSGDVLNTCSADGLELPDEACEADCIAASGGVAAHCEYLVPKFLPEVCDTLATQGDSIISSSITRDTTDDATCTGGIVAQVGGPPICVIRFRSLKINASRTLTLIGNRAVAIVTDGPLEVAGTIDASATGTTSGPGGGTTVSGGQASASKGGGGAGFAQNGGAGAISGSNGGGANGGVASSPLASAVLIGGPRPSNGSGPIQTFNRISGGGGGAVTLISCRNTVSVPAGGTLHVGGGGGQGGGDIIFGAQIDFVSSAGGGAGGFVVLQGLNVTVTGAVYANGGGGGAGSTTNDTSGSPGGDGLASTAAASGGTPSGNGGAGGAGGRQSSSPGVGLQSASSGAQGGGGGSMGFFQAAVPAGTSPILSPSAASPSFSPVVNVSTK